MITDRKHCIIKPLLITVVSVSIIIACALYFTANKNTFAMRSLARSILFNANESSVPIAILNGNEFVYALKRESKGWTYVNENNATIVAEILSSIKTNEAHDCLVELYESHELPSKITGAIGLGKIGKYLHDIDKDNAIIDSINDRGKYLNIAIIALGSIGQEKGKQYLFPILEDKVSISTKYLACEALSSIGGDDVIKAYRIILNGYKPELKPAAFRGLITLKDKSSIPLAIQSIDDSTVYTQLIIRQLEYVTDKNYGANKVLWDAWWKEDGERWVIPTNLHWYRSLSETVSEL